MKPDYEALQQDIIDQIKELQLKLGYEEETLRLYYHETTLRFLLKVDIDFDLRNDLEQHFAKEENVLGTLLFHLHQENWEVTIGPAGVRYVHETIPDPPFQKAFIELFSLNHHISVKQIKDLFQSFDLGYQMVKMDADADFDYVFYFDDPSIDPFYYCIKEEMGHVIYHRFRKEDYKRLLES